MCPYKLILVLTCQVLKSELIQQTQISQYPTMINYITVDKRCGTLHMLGKWVLCFSLLELPCLTWQVGKAIFVAPWS